MKIAVGRRRAATATLLGLLAMVPYLAAGPSREFFVVDDPVTVTENDVVRRGFTFEGVRWALTSFEASNWHPVTWLSHMLDVSLFGLDARGHHLTSILIHGLNAALLYLALARLTARPGPAALAAALFGVHPLHVESVAWIAERKDVLSGLFFMLVLLAYERYARRGGAGRYFLVALFLTLGLASKPMLVTLPLLLLLLDVWPLGRARLPWLDAGKDYVSWPRLLLEKAPLLALSAAASALTIAAQREGIADITSFPPAVRVANALVSWATYLVRFVWPEGLAVYYPHPRVLPAFGSVTGAIALLVLISLVAVLGLRRRPWLLVGWCWYLGMLVPVIGLVQVGGQAMADRYTYLPLCGAFIMAVWSIPGPRSLPGSAACRAAAAGAVLIVSLLAAAAMVQAGRWGSGEAILRHTLSVTEDNWFMHYNLGLTLDAEGRVGEAEEHFRETIRISPRFFEAYGHLGWLFLRQGQVEKALGHFRTAADLRPSSHEAHINLGIAFAATGRHDEAIISYREALRIRPDSPVPLNNIGNVLAAAGRLDEAVEMYRQALALQPDYTSALVNLGKAYERQGKLKEALGSYRDALRTRPDSAEIRLMLTNLLQALGRSP